ncbi:hypothetical protein [Pseudoxanthomonas mexicana]
MTAKDVSIAELYLAFRQAKSALFFEKRGVGMNELATYEVELPEKLKKLKRKLSGNSWFDKLDIGDVWVVPKRFHSKDESNDRVIRIGTSSQADPVRPVDVQIRISPNPEFAITEVLYLWQFGPLLESVLSEDVLGYRLDLRNSAVSKYRRWLFQYWPKSYREFRSAPLLAAKKILENEKEAIIFSADLANFYDTVDPGFLLSHKFLKELEQHGASSTTLRQYKKATLSLLFAYTRFREIASKRLALPVMVGIPIGALTSRIVANVALASLDEHISTRKGVSCYRRYVDDLVVVGTTRVDLKDDEIIRQYLPVLPGGDGILELDVKRLNRDGSELQVQERKVRVHHLGGEPGADFLDAVESDFTKALSERRSFIDESIVVGDGVSHLIRASNSAGSPLRVLREADRARLERFSLSTGLRSLERVTSMVDQKEARALVRNCLERVGRVLDAEANWVDDIDVSLRLMKLSITTGDLESARELTRRMDREWGTIESLRATTGELYYRGQKIEPRRVAPWIWLRNYLHERRLEAVCACMPINVRRSKTANSFPDGILFRQRMVGASMLRRRAERLASADLRSRDREDDGSSSPTLSTETKWLLRELNSDPTLKAHLESVESFLKRCRELGDRPWLMPAAHLYLCTRPPSYFDIARRWLYRVEDSGFDGSVFKDMLDIVNGVRGTKYSDPVGHAIDSSAIYIEDALRNDKGAGDLQNDEPRIILGNLVVDDSAWVAAATRVAGSTIGKPLLSKERLLGLAEVLEKAEKATRKGRQELLVLPELSLPRPWLRSVANHVVKSGRFGLVAGLEYYHYLNVPHVANQAVVVMPGPFMSVATWPWTKRLPAREEALQLSRLRKPVTFPSAPTIPPPRTVIHTDWGSFSVLICSELIEVRRVADLLGRADVVLCPAWNPDTASYDHLIQSAGFQLHAVIAIANNGHYSDCRAWAPRNERWERDLCRLIERDVNDVVHVDIPVASLTAFHEGDKQAKDPFKRLRSLLKERQYAQAREELKKIEEKLPGLWRPLPPDWPE